MNRITAPLLALFLAGCATPSMDVEKALIAGHALHDGFALGSSAAARSGACTGQCAVTVKTYLVQSETLLNSGDVTTALEIMTLIEPLLVKGH